MFLDKRQLFHVGFLDPMQVHVKSCRGEDGFKIDHTFAVVEEAMTGFLKLGKIDILLAYNIGYVLAGIIFQ